MSWLDTSVSPAVLKTRDGANAVWNNNDLAAAGLGVGLMALVSSLDAITTSGFYNCSGSATGAPFSGVFWSVEHRALNSTGNAIQVAISYGNRRHSRRQNAGVWGAWVETPSMNDFTASLVASAGYQKLPSGLIMQWGTASYVGTSGSTGLLVTLPITFPTGILSAWGSDSASSANSVGAAAVSTSTIRLWAKSSSTYTTTTINYEAIGY